MRPPLVVRTRLASALLAGLGLAALVPGCTTSGDDGEPEPDMFNVGPGPSPWAEDLDAAFMALSPEIQALAGDVEEGALAGTFAMRAVSASLVDTVIQGTHRGGGVNYRLLERTWDAEERRYTQTSTLCGGYNFTVAGVDAGVAPEVYRLVAPSTDEVALSSAETGAYLANGHVQLWGLEGVPDDQPLPADIAEADQAPWTEWIVDLEDDGHPGITLIVHGDLGPSEGTIDGEVYAIQRKTVSVSGVAVSPDYTTGRVFTTWESLALGSVPDLLQYIYQGSAEPHPDADQSWFEEKRIDEGASCDDVVAFIESGAFAEDAAPWSAP